MLIVSTAVTSLALALVPADSLSARAIIEKAHEAAGGAAWRRAVTNVMRGDATLYRNGNIAESVHADEYVMYRVYPLVVPAAHQGTGQFRLDARVKGQVLFKLKSGFMQPGRVRLYYNGAKEVDIRWTSATIGEPIPAETFVLVRKTP